MREITSIPIDEIEPGGDTYGRRRCGVCGHEWKGHPPAAVWSIQPVGWEPTPYDLTGEDRPPCGATLPPARLLAERGLMIISCDRRPFDAIETEEEGRDPARCLKRLPSHVCPVGVTPPPLIPRPEARGAGSIIPQVAAEFEWLFGPAPGNGHARDYPGPPPSDHERKGPDHRYGSEGLPFGKRRDEHGHVVDNPEEQRAIGLIRRFRRDGFSYYAVAKHLDLMGIRCRSRKWHPVSIRRFCEREGIS